jgi:NifB/MoaA-like Fe-S oxidoreductase
MNKTTALALTMGLTLGATTACSSGVRSLTANEIQYFQRLAERMDANRDMLAAGIADLEKLTRDYARMESALDVNASRQQLFAALTETVKDQTLSAAERDMAVLSVYELVSSESEAIDARLAVSIATNDELVARHDAMRHLVDAAIRNEKQILTELGQPATSQALRSATALLAEVRAMREELATSDNPKLQMLAAKAGALEKKASGALEKAESLLDKLNKVKG